MWMTKTTPRKKAAAAIAVLVLIGVIIGVGVLLQEHGPGNMGTGFLQGALISLVAFCIVIWRVARRPQQTITFERGWTQTGDERDDAVLTRALALLGIFAFPLTAAAAITIALGVEVAMVLFFLLVAQVAVFAVAFVVINKRS